MIRLQQKPVSRFERTGRALAAEGKAEGDSGEQPQRLPLRELLDAYRRAGTRPWQARLVTRICAELRLRDGLKEQAFYGGIREALAAQAQPLQATDRNADRDPG